MAEDTFKSYFDELWEKTNRAISHWFLWRAIYEAPPECIDKMNNHIKFFKFTYDAHLDMSLFHAFKVIDKHPDSLNIYKFLNYVEQNLDIFSDDEFRKRLDDNPHLESLIKRREEPTNKTVMEDKCKLNEFDNIISNLLTVRNKLKAHIDRKELKTDFEKDFPIKPTEYETLLCTLAKILSRYRYPYDAVIPSVYKDFNEDIKKLCENL